VRASTWHAAQELDRADPQDGDVVRVQRLADEGLSHRYSVEVVNEQPEDPPASAAPDKDEIPF
jgi:hypothetical protein